MFAGPRDIARDALPYLIERMLHASPERRDVLAGVLTASVPTLTRAHLFYVLGCLLKAPPARRRVLVAVLLFDANADTGHNPDHDIPDYRYRSLPC